jgi:plastocyanin
LRAEKIAIVVAAAVAVWAVPRAGTTIGVGTIKGKVMFTGTAPRNPLIAMGADPNCVKINAGTKVNQELVVVGPNGTLANVLVAIAGEVPGASVPKTPVVIEQRGCIYHPRMSAAMVGQTLHIINNDATLHNITGVSQKGNRFSLGQPGAGMSFDFTLKDPEMLMLVRCQVHKWMLGYIGVVSNPFYDVTGADGTFTLKSVPAGKYTIETWHERYGRHSKELEVSDGGTAVVDFTYTGTEPVPGFLVRDVF